MKVAIRADASSRLASGHVMRCKTLADVLRGQGADVRFICRQQPGHLIALLSEAGYRVATLPALVDVDQRVDAEETINALEGVAPDWLVVDHYDLDEEWEARLQHHVGRILAIDDLANRRHASDVLLDQNWFGREATHRYRGLVPDDCRCLLGPGYALLHPLFWQLRRSMPPGDGRIRTVLVFFGGVDSHNQTVAALEALRAPDLSHLRVDVVIGRANPRAAEVERLVNTRAGATLHRDLSSLAGLMARADAMLGAGGATTWERCCLGLPAIVTITGANQEPFTNAVAAAGAQLSLGQASRLTPEDWAAALREFDKSPDQVKARAAAARRLTDGLGVYRVAAILQPPRIRPRLRRALREDEWQPSAEMEPGELAVIGEDSRGVPVGRLRFGADAVGEKIATVTIDATLESNELSAALLRCALDLVSSREHPLSTEFQDRVTAFLEVPRRPVVNAERAGADALRITVLSERDSWLNDYLDDLLFEWFTQGYPVRWIHHPDDVVAGDVCFLLGCGTILDARQLGMNRHTLAVHESDLPRGRGWSPLTWQILEGADRIPVTLFEAVPKVDAGPIHLQTWITLDGTELIDELRARQAAATIGLCKEWVARYPAVVGTAISQTGPATTYRRRTPQDSELDPKKPLNEQFALLRVTDQERYPASFSLRGKRYVVSIRKDTPAA